MQEDTVHRSFPALELITVALQDSRCPVQLQGRHPVEQ